MNIGAIYSRMMQGAQGVGPAAETLPGGAGQAAGRSTYASFDQALANQLSDPPTVALHPQGTSGVNPSPNYRGFISQAIENANLRQNNATQAVQNIIQGDDPSLHRAMIAMEEASISFQMLAEMRNKIVESLQELLRMQV